MSDNEEVSLIRTKKPLKNIKEKPVDHVGEEPIMETKINTHDGRAGVLPKKQRPPKTEKQLEASKKMLEARRLQVQRIKEEKLAKQYEAYKKTETTAKCVVPPTHATGRMGCPHTVEEEEEEEDEEEEIIVVKKPKTKPLKKKKIVIVQQSDSEAESEEEQEIVKPKPKQNFGKSQQNSKSKITIGNQKPNWENYFC